MCVQYDNSTKHLNNTKHLSKATIQKSIVMAVVEVGLIYVN
jgi:hypothetical protein